MKGIIKTSAIVFVLLFGITRLIDFTGMKLDQWRDKKKQEQEQNEQDQFVRESVRINIEARNVDFLEEESALGIVEPRFDANHVRAVIDVYPDGRIEPDGITLSPDTRHKMIINYKETKEVKEFHTGKNDGHYYILTVDFATKDIDIRKVPEQEVLDSGEYKYYVNDDGTATISGWNDIGDKIVIPEKIDGRTVTKLGDWLFSYCEGMTSIELPDTLTTIGDRAFVWCSGLTSIKIPDSVTTIGDNTFEGCENLTLVVGNGSYAEQYAVEKQIPYTYAIEMTSD